MNLADFITSNALSRPLHPAVVSDEAVLTFQDLAALVDAAATRLATAGIRKGDVVGVCLQDHPAHLASTFALFRLGAVMLPMDWRWPLPEQARIAAAFEARFLLAEAQRPVPAGPSVIRIDAGWPTRATAGAPAPEARLDDHPAVLSLSSGATGEPKATVTTHAAFRERLLRQILASRAQPDDVCLLAMPLSFAAGRSFGWGYLLLGATLVLAPPLASAAELVAQCRRRGATSLTLVPAQARAMLGLGEGGSPLLPGLRWLICGGAPLGAEERLALRQALSPNLLDLYGTSATGLIASAGPSEQDGYPGAIGRALPGMTVEIVDEDDRPLPSGGVGRIRCRGPGMARGFWKPVPAGPEEFRGGWYYPGDFGAIDGNGVLTLAGRNSQIVIRGGITIRTPEIERVLLTHPAVREAAVFGAPAANGEDEILAFVCCTSPATSRDLLAHCRGQLPAYKIPQAFHVLEALPRNSAGKVLQKELLESIGR